jgi:hypothetical protein
VGTFAILWRKLSDLDKSIEQRRGKYIVAMVRKWRKALSIDPRWRLSVSVMDIENQGEISFDDANYFVADISITRALLNPRLTKKYFEKRAESIIVHELLHLLMLDYDGLCESFAPKSLTSEFEKRQEQLVTTLERAFLQISRKK